MKHTILAVDGETYSQAEEFVTLGLMLRTALGCDCIGCKVFRDIALANFKTDYLNDAMRCQKNSPLALEAILKDISVDEVRKRLEPEHFDRTLSRSSLVNLPDFLPFQRKFIQDHSQEPKQTALARRMVIFMMLMTWSLYVFTMMAMGMSFLDTKWQPWQLFVLNSAIITCCLLQLASCVVHYLRSSYTGKILSPWLLFQYSGLTEIPEEREHFRQYLFMSFFHARYTRLKMIRKHVWTGLLLGFAILLFALKLPFLAIPVLSCRIVILTSMQFEQQVLSLFVKHLTPEMVKYLNLTVDQDNCKSVS